MAAASSENMGLAANSRLPQPSRFGFGYPASISTSAPLQDITELQNNASMPLPQPSNKRPLSCHTNQPEPKRKVLSERGGDVNFGGHKPSASLSQIQAASTGATAAMPAQRPAVQGKSITSLASGSGTKTSTSSSRPPSSASNFFRTIGPGSRQPNSTSGRPPSSTNFARSYQGRAPPGHHPRPATAQGTHRKGSDTSSDRPPPEGMNRGFSFTGIQTQDIGLKKQRPCAVLSASHHKKRVVSNDLTDLAKDFAALGLQESTATVVATHRDRVVSQHQGGMTGQGSCQAPSHPSRSDAQMEKDMAHQVRLNASVTSATGRSQPYGMPETPRHRSSETVDTLNAVERLCATITSALKTPGRRSKSCSPIKSDFLTKDSNITNAYTAPAWMDERLKDVETQFSQMKEAMSFSLQNKSLLEDAVGVAKERATELERERSRIVEQNDQLNTEVATFRQQAQSLTVALDAEQRSHKYEVEDLKRNHRFALDGLRRELKEETDRLQREHREALEALERHYRMEREDERSQKSREMDALRARLGSEQQGLGKAITEKDHEIQMMRSQVEEIKSDLDREHTLRGKLQQELVELSTTNITLDNRNRALRDQIEFLESGKKDQSNKFTEMDAALHEALEDAREARQRLIKEETERRILFNKYQELKGNIRVMCRVRPAAGGADEGDEATIDYPDAEETSAKIEVTGSEEKNSLGLTRRSVHPFEFDRVFAPGVQNEEVFGEISQLVQSALDGYNVCIFCYGQTGSGKTYTMSSPDGVIPRATKMIYEAVTRLREKSWTYEMDGSFIEVYNEDLHDLLTPRGGAAGGAPAAAAAAAATAATEKLEIKHDEARKQTSVTNCKVVRLDSADTVDTMLRQAAGNRSVAATKSNERSSRSHSVFTLRLSGRNAATGEACEGTLNLVDLAGSERVKVSGAEGDRMREAQNINRSLSCLGDVIEHLGKGSAHVPFRNSKLTHLLQYSLGGNAKGNSKTLMFVMVSPLEAHVKETLTSLRFAKKVHQVHIGTAKSSKKIRDRSSDS